MGNVEKTIRYLKRNGISNTYYAVMERLFYKDVPLYTAKQAAYDGPLFEDIAFSVLVPVYETKEEHLRDMIDSVLAQVYPNFELVLADASKTDGPKRVIESYEDFRIKYVRISDNKGISENTNVAIDAASCEYSALLDHDDLLTPDALYEMAVKISMAKVHGTKVNMIYSDEDKCNADATKFFGAHIKQELNPDLLLSNNYICHFTVIRSELLKELKFRGEYNGSQDYDLFLRVLLNSDPDTILHINKVLYHWRCHESSTAFNPASKEYAYVAGRNAIKSYVKEKYHKDMEVTELSHKGFYKVQWGDVFDVREDVGATACLLRRKNKIVSGIINKEGMESFEGMNIHYSGYMHRAHLTQDIYAADIRAIVPSPKLINEYSELVKELEYYKEKHPKASPVQIRKVSKELGMNFGQILEKKGLKLLYVYDVKEEP